MHIDFARLTANSARKTQAQAGEGDRVTISEAKLELAIAPFAAGRLSMGKAVELAALPVAEFQLHLGTRHLGPHYDAADTREDLETLAALPRA